jgi:hypothetical protein
MRPRLSVVLGCSLVAATLASGASAKTQLFVSGPPETAASGTTVLQVKGAPQDAAWAQVTTFVASGYTINLGQPNGTRIGSASAQVQLLESGSTAAATGVVLVADTNDATLQQTATQCTGAPVHAAVWLVRLIVSTQTLDIHVYIDPTTGTDVRLGSAKLVFCLPQPYAKALSRPGRRAARRATSPQRSRRRDSSVCPRRCRCRRSSRRRVEGSA